VDRARRRNHPRSVHGDGIDRCCCHPTGRRFIGIELDPKHLGTACARIEQAHAESELFTPLPNTRPVHLGFVVRRLALRATELPPPAPLAIPSRWPRRTAVQRLVRNAFSSGDATIHENCGRSLT
jgi:hypothetical protein